MRLTLVALLAVTMVGVGVPAYAELQNVEVGGSLRIRGNWLSDAGMTFDNDNPADLNFEQRTTLNVKADFTDDVTAFIELDNWGHWGEAGDFRSNVVTGGDGSSVGGTGLGDVALYQAYIELREAWGYPLSFRIGRQEIQLGSEWLIGNNDTASDFRGLSFDGVVGTYAAEDFSLSAFFIRLVEDGNAAVIEHAEDTDVLGLYGTYNGLEDITIDAYWLWVRSAKIAGAPDPDSGSLHTFGARAAGNTGAFDWEAEAAYQTGDSIPGTAATISNGAGVYGAGGGGVGAGVDVDVSAFAFHGEAGYTFDIEYSPRVYVAGAYYDGGDDPTTFPAAGDFDTGFNRLFSDHEYSEFLGNTDLSNIWIISGGASAQVTEEIEVSGVISYFHAVEEMGAADNSVGLEIGVYATYQYSEDLAIEAGYARFFANDAIEQGAAIIDNGTGAIASGAGNDDGLNYAYVETRIRF